MWEGILAGFLGKNDGLQLTGFEFGEESYVFQSVAQMRGMSGGPTVNSCGYAGMAHHHGTDTLNVSVIVTNAIVLPADKIIQCIEKNLYRFKNISECPRVKVVKVPRLDSDCSTSSTD
jgi:hypothetical protein